MSSFKRHPLYSRGWVCLACLSLTLAVQAHEGEEGHTHAVTAVGPAELYAPTAMPDRIILTISDDPRTTQSVTWRTSIEVQTALAEISKGEAGPHYPEKAKAYVAASEALKTDLNTAHFHSVTFRDLEPGTVYAYRVGDGVNWSEWFQFRTASATAEPFSFVYFGDAQNDIRSLWSRVIREAYRDAPKAAFLLHAGDLINRADSDGEWGEWFGAGGWLNAMTPSIAVPGNHEQARGLTGQRYLSQHWRPSFAFPENGPQGLEESCFTFTYHNLRVVGLNSNTMLTEQSQWLSDVLEKNESQWVVCTFHHPVFSTGKDRDNPELRSLWKPIFDKYRVDLVLQGHDHTYGRTGLQVPSAEWTPEATAEAAAVTNSNRKVQLATAKVGDVNVPTGMQQFDQEAGTVYVVSVSGPKMYDNTRYNFMQRLAEDTQLYQIIHLDGDVLRFEARTAVGQLYDAFELHKQPGQVNRLVELEPEVEQNLRSSTAE